MVASVNLERNLMDRLLNNQNGIVVVDTNGAIFAVFALNSTKIGPYMYDMLVG